MSRLWAKPVAGGVDVCERHNITEEEYCYDPYIFNVCFKAIQLSWHSGSISIESGDKADFEKHAHYVSPSIFVRDADWIKGSLKQLEGAAFSVFGEDDRPGIEYFDLCIRRQSTLEKERKRQDQVKAYCEFNRFNSAWFSTYVLPEKSQGFFTRRAARVLDVTLFLQDDDFDEIKGEIRSGLIQELNLSISNWSGLYAMCSSINEKPDEYKLLTEKSLRVIDNDTGMNLLNWNDFSSVTIDWDVSPNKDFDESLRDMDDESVYVTNLDNGLDDLTEAVTSKLEVISEQILGLHKSVNSGFDGLWFTLLFVIAFLIFDYFF